METLIMTALGRALALTEDCISKASDVKSANIAACIEYLRAAKSAITGLEEEVDEILIEAKMVAGFHWDKKSALYERIDRYLNRDRLRPLLDQAIQGITACHKFAKRDSEGFFLHREKAEAVEGVVRLLGELSHYLASLGGRMELSTENYASGSGINMPELLEIQKLLLSQSDSADDDQRRTRLTEVAKEAQSRRLRQGYPLAAESFRTIQELSVAFKLQRSGDG